ncbi:MAG: peptidylprolyl isomerase [Gammaproteobacteria bacterium]
MSQAEMGQTVRVHYTGKLTDGEQFDASRPRGEPLEFTIGLRQVIEGFENAVVGMSVGDTRSVEIPVEQAYGKRRDEMVADFPRAEIPDTIELEEGMTLTSTSPDGKTMHFRVESFNEEVVTLDANHPLSGEDLIFEIELLEIL